MRSFLSRTGLRNDEFHLLCHQVRFLILNLPRVFAGGQVFGQDKRRPAFEAAHALIRADQIGINRLGFIRRGF